MRKIIRILTIALGLSLALGLFAACKKAEPKKTTLNAPVIVEKTYTGGLLTADVPENEGYVVEANAGGTNAGEYSVVLKLSDAKKYEWATPDADDAEKLTLVFKINKAADAINGLADFKTTCKTLPSSVKGVSAVSGLPVSYKFSKDGENWTDGIEENELVAGAEFFVKAYTPGNENYTAAESGKVKMTVNHKYGSVTKISRGVYEVKCACGTKKDLPTVTAAFTLDGAELKSFEVPYGSVLTREQLDEVIALAEKDTDRKVTDVGYDVDAENDEDVELLDNVTIEVKLDYGALVEGSVFKLFYLSTSINPYTVVDTEVAAPAGFTRVNKTALQKTSNYAYSSVDIRGYKTVFFAVKTNGTFNLETTDDEGNLISKPYTDGGWLYFTVARNADGESWDVTVTDESGMVIAERKGMSGKKDVPGFYVNDSLGAILWGKAAKGFCWNLAEGQYLWGTEVRADRTAEARAAKRGDIIADATLFDKDKLDVDDVTATVADITVASGFNKIYKNKDSVTTFNARALSDYALTAYSEVNFAVMSNWIINASKFNEKCEGYMSWMYFNLKNNGETDGKPSWTVTITDEGGNVYYTATVNGHNPHPSYVADSIDDILWGMGDVFQIKNGVSSDPVMTVAGRNIGAMEVYCTEIRGTLKTVAA